MLLFWIIMLFVPPIISVVIYLKLLKKEFDIYTDWVVYLIFTFLLLLSNFTVITIVSYQRLIMFQQEQVSFIFKYCFISLIFAIVFPYLGYTFRNFDLDKVILMFIPRKKSDYKNDFEDSIHKINKFYFNLPTKELKKLQDIIKTAERVIIFSELEFEGLNKTLLYNINYDEIRETDFIVYITSDLNLKDKNIINHKNLVFILPNNLDIKTNWYINLPIENLHPYTFQICNIINIIINNSLSEFHV